jgi:hypothetical protein
VSRNGIICSKYDHVAKYFIDDAFYKKNKVLVDEIEDKNKKKSLKRLWSEIAIDS